MCGSENRHFSSPQSKEKWPKHPKAIDCAGLGSQFNWEASHLAATWQPPGVELCHGTLTPVDCCRQLARKPPRRFLVLGTIFAVSLSAGLDGSFCIWFGWSPGRDDYELVEEVVHPWSYFEENGEDAWQAACERPSAAGDKRLLVLCRLRSAVA
eukprot:s216_g19.t1